MDYLRQVNNKVFANVDGWVGDRVHNIVKFIDEDHNEHNVHGDIAEIGVHHGKFFFIISSISRSGERCIAIDLYENQALNVDNSGAGSRAAFESHLTNLFPDFISKTSIVSADSMSLTPSNARSRLGTEAVRLFSVDGGHTVDHVVNDLSIAQEIITTRGTIVLDDIFGPHWPTVTEGFYKYMTVANRRLAPFLTFQNKLFLTTFSEHEQVIEKLRNFLDREIGEEMHSGRWRYVKFCGFRCLSYV